MKNERTGTQGSLQKCEARFELNWRVGARTAAFIVSIASKYKSAIEVRHGRSKGNAKSVMDWMLFDDALNAGAVIRVRARGEDAVIAMLELTRLFSVGTRQDRCPQARCSSTPILESYSDNTIFYACSNWHAWAVIERPKKSVYPRKGVFPWPGRHKLSVRDRILLESRTTQELFSAIGEIEGDVESTLGRLKYLVSDWMWLHDAKHRARFPDNYSIHNNFLNTNASYRKKMQWKGLTPGTDMVLDWWRALTN